MLAQDYLIRATDTTHGEYTKRNVGYDVNRDFLARYAESGMCVTFGARDCNYLLILSKSSVPTSNWCILLICALSVFSLKYDDHE